jgi:tRNA-specific 2-thiouridylase
MKKQTVFVGLSGGVDSSVSAALLMEQKYNVVGVFIKVWHPEFMVCNWEQERVDAMRVAAYLGIPFLTCDAEATYKQAVADYFIESYQRGHTPNPDVLCNKEVKFGAFLDFAKAQGADFIATGHYAQVEHHKNSAVLRRGVDAIKDQSYFLWSLTTDQLAHTLFPIGHLPKSTVRDLARTYGLPTATKRDSQGICFLGHVDIPNFLSHYVPLKQGIVVDTHGNEIGVHQGALVYTIGQRHGFTVTNSDYAGVVLYVCDKDITTNTLVVDSQRPTIHTGNQLVLSHVVLREPIQPGDTLEAQTRYRQTPFTTVVTQHEGGTLTCRIETPNDMPAVGQSCVLYRDDVCIGGGIIERCHL